ncbi:hypothetical protein E5161_12695 [Cohnella pontilimi]|uniref:NACHT domain-containing protein n=1 Tax=Cohnella pontilimi TaxID=2564100 RepID=A0A4U0F9B4_9BACL|nr:PRK06851 family protein [Cohnella pontilimi]TJY41285.1 hypothetical protein E5161_12695 [Cohnella pontilimi]
MTGTERHYFARGNTARGEVVQYESALRDLSRIYVLQGPPGTAKPTLIRSLAAGIRNEGEDVEWFHSPLHPDDVDIVILRNSGIAIVDGTACPYSAQDTRTIAIDLTPAVDSRLLPANYEETAEVLNKKLSDAYSSAYACFADALRIHDEWEAPYIENLDFQKSDEVAREFSESWLASPMENKQAAVRHLFFGAATPLGAIDHIQNLTSGLNTRIFIKGRPGSGKSTLLKRLAAEAESKGYDLDVFHCGFDPNSLDMLIFPELGLAVFDSTAPHEYFPDRTSDRILDMYERVIKPGVDERYAEQLADIKSRYAQKMKEATSYLGEARDVHFKIRELYRTAVDFSVVDRSLSGLRNEFVNKTPTA